jgi:hypothetical protein
MNLPVPVAAGSGVGLQFVGSIFVGSMEVCLLLLLCVVR